MDCAGQLVTTKSIFQAHICRTPLQPNISKRVRKCEKSFCFCLVQNEFFLEISHLWERRCCTCCMLKMHREILLRLFTVVFVFLFCLVVVCIPGQSWNRNQIEHVEKPCFSKMRHSKKKFIHHQTEQIFFVHSLSVLDMFGWKEVLLMRASQVLLVVTTKPTRYTMSIRNDLFLRKTSPIKGERSRQCYCTTCMDLEGVVDSTLLVFYVCIHSA